MFLIGEKLPRRKPDFSTSPTVPDTSPSSAKAARGAELKTAMGSEELMEGGADPFGGGAGLATASVPGELDRLILESCKNYRRLEDKQTNYCLRNVQKFPYIH